MVKRARYPVFLFIVFGGLLMIALLASFQQTESGDIQSISWILNSDWMMHLSQVQAFAKLPFLEVVFNHPLYSGEVLAYPFFVNWFSGILLHFTNNLVFSMLVPSLIGTIIFLAGGYFLGYTIFKSRLAPFIAIFLLFFGGGSAIFALFNNYPLAQIFSSRDYKQDALLVEMGYYWKSFFFTSFLPQRALAWGMGVSFFCYAIFWEFLEKEFKGIAKWKIFLLGIGFGSLTYFHTHSFLFAFLLLTIFSLFSIKYFYSYIIITLGALASALPFLFLLLNKKSKLFIKFFPLSQNLIMENVFIFWLKNWGVLFLIPILLLVFLLIKFNTVKQFAENSINDKNKNLIKLFLTTIIVFVISNVVQFQPNWWDNTKIWIWILFFFNLFTAYIFIFLWKKYGWQMKVLLAILFLLAIISNVWLTVKPILDKKTIVFTKQELLTAKKFQEIIPSDALILTDDYFHLFVGPLTPNQLFMGYEGWLISYGMDTEKKKQIIAEIFSGDKDAKRYLKEKQIDYVVIDDNARRNYKINQKFFDNNFELVLLLPDDVVVYKIVGH